MKVRVGEILLGCFALLVVYRIVGMVPGFKESDREEKDLLQAFDLYTGSIVSQHYEKAYAACGNDFHQATPYDKFVSIYKSLDEKYGPLKSAQQVRYEMHGHGTPELWNAVIDADFFYAKQTLRFKFSARKEGDRWILYGFEEQ